MIDKIFIRVIIHEAKNLVLYVMLRFLESFVFVTTYKYRT